MQRRWSLVELAQIRFEPEYLTYMYDVMIYWINNQSCMQDLCTIGGARLPNDLETINSAYDVCEDRMPQDRLTAEPCSSIWRLFRSEEQGLADVARAGPTARHFFSFDRVQWWDAP